MATKYILLAVFVQIFGIDALPPPPQEGEVDARPSYFYAMDHLKNQFNINQNNVVNIGTMLEHVLGVDDHDDKNATQVITEKVNEMGKEIVAVKVDELKRETAKIEKDVVTEDKKIGSDDKEVVAAKAIGAETKAKAEDASKGKKNENKKRKDNNSKDNNVDKDSMEGSKEK